MIDLKNVSFSYSENNESKLLDQISLHIDDGEFVAITGHNGAGKSTLSKLIAGILKSTQGQVCIDGENIFKTKQSILAKKIGFLFQNPDRQLCCYTIKEELAFGMKAQRKYSSQEIETRVNKLIEKFNFNGSEAPFVLSRGQRQRLALACIIAVRPKIMILDEPTTGLDYSECMELMNEIKNLNQNGTTVIMVCHDMELVLDFAERMIVVNECKIKADGKTKNILYEQKVLDDSGLIAPQIILLTQKLIQNKIINDDCRFTNSQELSSYIKCKEIV